MPNYVVVPTTILIGSLNLVKANNCYLRLYSNDYTPTATSVLANFTEVAGGGYAQKAILGDESTASAWTMESTNIPPDIILAEQTYACTSLFTGPQTAYGWYLVTQASSAVRASKRLDTPYTPASGGGTLKFTPRIQAGTGISAT